MKTPIKSTANRMFLPDGFNRLDINLDLDILQLGIAPSNKSRCNICYSEIKIGDHIATTKKKKPFGNKGIIANVKKYICLKCLIEIINSTSGKLDKIKSYIKEIPGQNYNIKDPFV